MVCVKEKLTGHFGEPLRKSGPNNRSLGVEQLSGDCRDAGTFVGRREVLVSSTGTR